MRTGHRKNVGGLINQRSRQRLAAQIADVCAFLRADFYGVHAWWLATNCVHAGGCVFDVFPVASQAAKKPFGDRTPTTIACADEEDVFHELQHPASAFSKLEANLSKSISDAAGALFRRGL